MKRPAGDGPAISRETSARLDALAAEHDLPASAVAALTSLLALQATDPTASTTVRDPADAVDRHVADSLVGARRSASCAARGGSPTSAPARAGRGWRSRRRCPAREVVLVESAIRHCRYLERAAAEAGLANVAVVHARAEEWPDGIGAHDLVTARALAALPVLCEYAAPLLADGGALVAWKGAVDAGRGGRRRAPRPRSSGSRRPSRDGWSRTRARAPHAARVPQDRAHARPVPAPARDGDETAAVRQGSAPTLNISR